MAGTFLGGVLAAINLALPPRPESHQWVVGLIWICLVAMERRTGALWRTAGHFIVPASWVRSASPRVGLFWGLVHGLAILTEPPFVPFHAAVIGSLWLNGWIYPLALGILFGSGRILTTVVPAVRSMIVDSCEAEPEEQRSPRSPKGPISGGRFLASAMTTALAVAVLSGVVVDR